MTSFYIFSKTQPNNIIGLKVSASKNVIGTVTGVIKSEDNLIHSIDVRKDRDSTVLSVHQNRIAGVDEEKGLIIIN